MRSALLKSEMYYWLSEAITDRRRVVVVTAVLSHVAAETRQNRFQRGRQCWRSDVSSGTHSGALFRRCSPPVRISPTKVDQVRYSRGTRDFARVGIIESKIDACEKSLLRGSRDHLSRRAAVRMRHIPSVRRSPFVTLASKALRYTER